MREIREHLACGTFAEFRREFVANYVPSQRVLSARLLAKSSEEER
jgi:hypothetical protein